MAPARNISLANFPWPSLVFFTCASPTILSVPLVVEEHRNCPIILKTRTEVIQRIDICHEADFGFFEHLLMSKIRGGLAGVLNGPIDSILISETDPYGNIILANDNFCAVSQYGREELIGSPHNIIRHPAMPKELFKYLWSTIKRGEVFRGIIKNLKKDGSPYWVNATVIPVFQNDKIAGYIGGRSLLNDEKAAEQLFNEEAQRYLI